MYRRLITCLILFYSIIGSAQIAAVLQNAENGDLDCQKFLARSYAVGQNGVRKNDNLRFVWTKAAAEQGDPEYEYELSQLYFFGIGTPNDTNAMMEWMMKSAEHKYGPAMENLGYLFYMMGNYYDAIRLLEGAIEQGVVEAYHTLGKAYLEGNGVEQDQEEAVRLFNVAIDSGVSVAYRDLAYCYAEGKGVKKDFKKAHSLIDNAIQLHPNEMEYYDDKGTFFLMEGNLSKAQEIWEKILNYDSNYPETSQTVFSAAMTGSVDYNIPTNTEKNSNTLVLIISNEHYRRVAPVIFANYDGCVFENYCTATLGIPEQNIIYVEDGTLADIKYNVDALKQRVNSNPNRYDVICYYAGHGIPDFGEKTAYLLPVDSYGTDTSTGYSLDDFYTIMSELPAKSVIVFMDACFSGAKREGDMLVAARGVAIKVKNHKPKGNMVVFSAAQGDETAFPYEKQKHGLFTYYLLRKLQETNGEATLGEIADYVSAEVLEKSLELHGKAQTPTVVVSNSMESSWRNMKLK